MRILRWIPVGILALACANAPTQPEEISFRHKCRVAGYTVSLNTHSASGVVGDNAAVSASVTRPCGGEVTSVIMTWTVRNTAVVSPVTATDKGVTLDFIGAGTTYVVASSNGGGKDSILVTVTSGGGGVGIQATMADSVVDAIGLNNHIDRGTDANWNSIIRPRTIELGVRHVRGVGATDVSATTKARALDLYNTAGITFGKGCKHGANFTDASICITQLNALKISGQPPAWLDFVGGENEMDAGDASFVTHWLSWQTAMYNAYKADPVWSAYPVVMSSISQSSAEAKLGKHPSVLDIGDMHSYPSGNMPSNVSTNWIPAVKSVVGTKPYWATETGYHNSISWTGGNQPISELGGGKYFGRLPFEYWNRGVSRFYAYELWDEGTTTDREDHFGLVRNDGSPKPAFTILKNIITLLGDPGAPFTTGQLDYSLTGALSTTHKTLMQKRNGRFYLALWQEISVWDRTNKVDISNSNDALTLNLGVAASAIHVYKPSVGTSSIQDGSGTSISLSVPDEVIIVEIVP